MRSYLNQTLLINNHNLPVPLFIICVSLIKQLLAIISPLSTKISHSREFLRTRYRDGKIRCVRLCYQAKSAHVFKMYHETDIKLRSHLLLKRLFLLQIPRKSIKQKCEFAFTHLLLDLIDQERNNDIAADKATSSSGSDGVHNVGLVGQGTID